MEGSMSKGLNRREFLHMAAAGSALCLGSPPLWAGGRRQGEPRMISPGCRSSRVKVARLYMGSDHGLWPKPKLDFQKEIRTYASAFSAQQDQLADVDFYVDTLVTDPEQVKRLSARLKEADGILAVHFNIGVGPVLSEILSLGVPTMVFAVPYSGHEWVHWGELRKTPQGSRMDCILSSDLGQLAVAVRPFRAIHHLREARVLNLTTRDFSAQAKAIRDKFGTEIKPIKLEDVVEAYAAVKEDAALSEASRP